MDEAEALTAEVFAHLDVNIASSLLEQMPAEHFNEIVPKLNPQKASAIIIGIDPQIRAKLISKLPSKSRELVRELLTYPEQSAGRMMSTDVLALRQDIKVKEAMQRIRNMAVKKTPYSYTYVVDDGRHLLGVITMRDLILATSDTPILEFMKTDVFAVNAFADIEEVANQVLKRKYL